MRRIGSLLGTWALLGLVSASVAQAQTCVGDCSDMDEVTIANLITGVNIALGSLPPSACPAFQNEQGQVDIAQLIKGVNNALNGCTQGPTPTPTTTPAATVERDFIIDQIRGTLAPPDGTCTDTSMVCTVDANCTAPKTCDGNTVTGLFSSALSNSNVTLDFSPGPLKLLLGAPDGNGVAPLSLKEDVALSITVITSQCLCVTLLAAGSTGSIDCDGGTAYDTTITQAAGPGTSWAVTTGQGAPAGPGNGNLLVMGKFQYTQLTCEVADCAHFAYTDPPNLFPFTTTLATGVKEVGGPPLTLTVGGAPFSCANFANPGSGGVLSSGAAITIDPGTGPIDTADAFRFGEKKP